MGVGKDCSGEGKIYIQPCLHPRLDLLEETTLDELESRGKGKGRPLFVWKEICHPLAKYRMAQMIA